MTPRMRDFIVRYTDPNSKTYSNAYQSAVAAGYAAETAKRITADLPEKARLSIQQALESKGADSEYLADRHIALLDKKETIVVHEGKESHIELTEQPHSDVKGALDMAYKLTGSYAPEKHEHTGTLVSDLLEKKRRAETD